MVADNESGWLIARGDVDELARKVLILLGDPARRESMGIAGRRRVDARFNLRTNVARLVESYGIGQKAGAGVMGT